MRAAMWMIGGAMLKKIISRIKEFFWPPIEEPPVSRPRGGHDSAEIDDPMNTMNYRIRRGDKDPTGSQ